MGYGLAYRKFAYIAEILFVSMLMTLIFLPMLDDAYAKEITIYHPPALVACKSFKECDRDPRHLEVFISDFYKWYVMIIDLPNF